MEENTPNIDILASVGTRAHTHSSHHSWDHAPALLYSLADFKAEPYSFSSYEPLSRQGCHLVKLALDNLKDPVTGKMASSSHANLSEPIQPTWRALFTTSWRFRLVEGLLSQLTFSILGRPDSFLSCVSLPTSACSVAQAAKSLS